eukprot:157159-Ditylum_brightwellii.AAC.1
MTNLNATKAKHKAVAPSTSFPWDKDDENFEEALEIEEDSKKDGVTGWKRAGDEKGQKGIEWTMMDDCMKFNIYAALIAILGKIQTVDNRTYVKSNVTNHIWKDFLDIPIGAEFSKAYIVQQEQM